MLNIFDTIAQITSEKTAKEIIIFLIDNFDFYISTEDLQKLNI